MLERGGFRIVRAGGVMISWTVPMLNRALTLRQAGLSYGAISKTLKVDYGVEVSDTAIRKRLIERFDVPRDSARNNFDHRRRAA